MRTTSSKSWQNPYSPAQRKPLTGNYILVGLVSLILVLYFYPRRNVAEENTLPSGETVVSETDKSIAVLPFADLSPNKDQEYFSVGMMDEILSHLVKIEDLKVTSRTSVMRYSGTNKSIKDISQELGVTNILEGSVRRAGTRVRITVQLINGETDDHLWSQTYDREITT